MGRTIRDAVSSRAAPAAFLTVVSFPEGATNDDVAALLARSGWPDEQSARLALARGAPAVLAAPGPGVAAVCRDAVRAAGGTALVHTMRDIEGVGATIKVSRLEVSAGGLELTVWRGPEFRVPLERLRVIVRGEIRTTTTDHLRSAGGSSASMAVLAPGASVPDALDDAVPAPSGRSTRISHRIDLHTSDRLVIQIDGDRFNFSALGGMRGYSDKFNADRLFDLLCHVAPDAVADDYFRLFKPPRGALRIRLKDMRINNEDPAFAFYSRWTALVYRAVLAGEA